MSSAELICAEALSRELPKAHRLFAARRLLNRCIVIDKLRLGWFHVIEFRTMTVYAFAARNREQPWRERAPAIELADALERFNEGVLRHFAGIGRIAAKLSSEGIDAIFEAVNELFERVERAGLRLTGQLLVRNLCKVLVQCWMTQQTTGLA